MNHCPVDSVVCFVNTYPVDSVIRLSNNWGQAITVAIQWRFQHEVEVQTLSNVIKLFETKHNICHKIGLHQLEFLDVIFTSI